MTFGPTVRRVALALAWRPEWPVAGLVGAGWLLLTGLQIAGSHRLHAPPSLGGWAVMSFLMMVPVTLPAVRHVAFNSIRARRRRAMAVYLGAYLAAWTAFGVLPLGMIEAARRVGLASHIMLIAALAIAAAWQLSETRRQCILRCRRTVPLPPVGRRADAACARFALLQAGHCGIVCWPVMLVMAVHGHDFWLMAGVTGLVVAEEQASWRERIFAPAAAAFAAAAVIALVRLPAG